MDIEQSLKTAFKLNSDYPVAYTKTIMNLTDILWTKLGDRLAETLDDNAKIELTKLLSEGDETKIAAFVRSVIDDPEKLISEIIDEMVADHEQIFGKIS